eukprot:6748750-Karenia_brevis.AAC.1
MSEEAEIADGTEDCNDDAEDEDDEDKGDDADVTDNVSKKDEVDDSEYQAAPMSAKSSSGNICQSGRGTS